jgi:ribonucleoside-diphosphate reductase beta chain
VKDNIMNLLTPRDYYKPFAYPFAFDAYRTMRKMAWEPEEVNLSEDISDWNYKLNDAERNLLTQLFRFFTQGDVDVAAAYRDTYLPAFKHPELAMMLFAFGDSEANHVHAYSLLLDTIGMPETEYQAFHQFKEMQAKHEYLFATRDGPIGLNPKDKKIYKLALDLAIFSAFSEGMQLFSSFAMLMHFQTRGRMKGMTTIVEWSIRDESHHVKSMIELFHILIKENPRIWNDSLKKAIYQTCRDMVALEDQFIDLAFIQGGIKDLTADSVKIYIRYIADRRLNQLGLKANYGIEISPFPWLDWIVGAPTHTNFFEQRSTEYSRADLDWSKVIW